MEGKKEAYKKEKRLIEKKIVKGKGEGKKVILVVKEKG